MTNLPKCLMLAAMLSLGAAAVAAPLPAAPPAAGGQAQYGQTVTCSSNDGERHHCNMNTSGGVQMVQQLSGTPCSQGQSWGFDGRSVWVDHGCRAKFAPGNPGQPGQTLSCSSDDGNRHHCNANVSGGVQMTRQVSGSPCVQGQSWGYDNSGIWVDHGCRAEFSTGGNGYGYGNGYGNGFGNGQGQTGQTITCSSDDGKRHYCGINTGGGVQLTQQISGSPCIQGQTWGYDNQGVWVDRGCRAQFSSGGNGYNRRFGRGQGQTITCSSDDGNRHWCTTNVNGGRARARMTRQISGSPCIEGQTWGVDSRGLWVDRGCRAEFQVR